MKKMTLLLTISLLMSAADVSAKWYRMFYFYIGSNVYSQRTPETLYTFHLDTLVADEQSISIALAYSIYWGDGFESWDHMTSFSWYMNDVLVSNDSEYVATDTGNYKGVFINLYSDTLYAYLHIGYDNATSVKEITNSSFSMYPSISTGVFSLKTKTPLTKIIITDATGKTVFTSTQNLPFIDISNLPEGIYFYYVEDKSLQVYRGRLVKN
jgi:hypothetical protein